MLFYILCTLLFCTGAGVERGMRDLSGRKSATQLFEQQAANSVAFIDMDLMNQAEEPDLSFTELRGEIKGTVGNSAEAAVKATRDLRRQSWKNYWDARKASSDDAEDTLPASSQQDQSRKESPSVTADPLSSGEVSFDEMEDYDLKEMEGEQQAEPHTDQKVEAKPDESSEQEVTSKNSGMEARGEISFDEMDDMESVDVEKESAKKATTLARASKYETLVSRSLHRQSGPVIGHKNLVWRSYWAHKKELERQEEIGLEDSKEKTLQEDQHVDDSQQHPLVIPGESTASRPAPIHLQALEQGIAPDQSQPKPMLSTALSKSNSQLDSVPHSSQQTNPASLDDKKPVEQVMKTSGTPVSLVDGECIIVGEKRLVGFDTAEQVSLFGESASQKLESHEAWLVKSSLVHIQGRFDAVNGVRSLRGLAVGGPFIGGNTLIIRGRAVNGKVFWNNDRILEKAPSEYENRFISARYHSRAPLVHDPKHVADTPAIDMKLPLGIRLIVNRGKDGLGLKIKMHRLGQDQDGQCGNFNGNPLDDSLDKISSRIGHIQPAELLFRRDDKKSTVHAETTGQDVTQSERKAEPPLHGEVLYRESMDVASFGQEADCVIYGDPHVSGFDKVMVPVLTNRLSLLDQHQQAGQYAVGAGDTWLVKTPQVQIQGRFNVVDERGRSFLRGIAVGGPFLKGSVLLVAGPHFKEERASGKTFWNGEEILASVPSEFKNGLISARHRANVPLVQDASRIAQLPGLDIELPLGVKLAVNRGKHGLGVKLTMRRMPGPQDGQCGNFNGDMSDETAELISTRLGTEIPASELLFRHPFN